MSIYAGVVSQDAAPPSSGWAMTVSEVQQPGGAPSSAIVGIYDCDGNKNLTDPNALGYLASSLSTTSETYESHTGALATAGFNEYMATSTARRSVWGTLPDDYFRSTGITISFLFRRVNDPASNLAVLAWVFADGEAWRVRCSSTNSIRIVASYGGTNQTSDALAIASSPLSDANWHHVVWTYDANGTSKFYIDGVLYIDYTQPSLTSPMHSYETNIRRAWGAGGDWNSNTTNRFGEPDHITILRGVYPPTPAA